MNLPSLFKSEERLKILEYVMVRENLRVTDIARELNVSKGLVSEFLRTLQKNGLVKRKRGAAYSIIDNFATREVKRLINLSKVNLQRIDRKSVVGIGIYGSWARGTNTIESDIDVWVKVRKYPSQDHLAKLSSQLRKIFRCDVRLLVLAPAKIVAIKKDEVFFSNLIKDSILLWGEEIA